MTRNIKIAVGVILVIVLAYFVFDKKAEPVVDEVTPKTATSTDSEVDVGITADGNYTIKKISETTIGGSKVSAPDINRAIVFGNNTNYDQSTKNIITEKMLALQAELKKDSDNLLAWINLGLYQKMIGDYIGAILSWKYVSLRSPTDYISTGNLGDLYAYYLKDKLTAEKYYKKAILNAPNQAYLYAQLSAVYRDVFGDIAKARSIIDEGLSKIPNDQGLLEARANLK